MALCARKPSTLPHSSVRRIVRPFAAPTQHKYRDLRDRDFENESNSDGQMEGEAAAAAHIHQTFQIAVREDIQHPEHESKL